MNSKIKKPLSFIGPFILSVLAVGGLIFIQQDINLIFMSSGLTLGTIIAGVIISFIIFLPLIFPSLSIKKKIIIYPLCSLLVILGLFVALLTVAKIFEGDKYAYTANILSTSESKFRKSANACTYTAYWWDAVVNDYKFICTTKELWQHIDKGRPAIINVEATTYLNGMMSKLISTRVDMHEL